MEKIVNMKFFSVTTSLSGFLNAPGAVGSFEKQK